MFELTPDERLSAWAEHRRQLETSPHPLEDLVKLWGSAPYIPYNRLVDPYDPRRWPTPWDILIENKYDDFTKALMMAWTLKLTDTFKNTKIEIKTYTDADRSKQYNLVFIDDKFVINYADNYVNLPKEIPESFRLENLIEVSRPR